MINLLTFLGFFIFTCAGMVFIKLGSHPQYHTFMTIPILDFKLSAVSLIGFLLYGFSFLLYSSLLPKYDLTFLNPVTIGITAILIFICGVAIFNETVTLVKVVGLALILSGVLIINLIK
jgi:drug/metabolite transporter (DMT)-like permease